MPMEDNFIKLLVKILERINDSEEDRTDKLINAEIKLCQLLTNDNKRYSSSARLKFYRRTLFLNELVSDKKVKEDNEKNIPREFHFPKDLKLIADFVNNRINSDFYSQRLRINTESFDEKLIYGSYWPDFRNCYTFTILRKWQSYTPSLGSHSDSSMGGGYFIYRVDIEGRITEGIVVDPGYDFIENFFEKGFSVLDISAIVFTHSHIDHSADFHGLVTLIHEMNRRAKKQKLGWKQQKITVVATPCCFDHFYHALNESRDCIKDIVVVDPERYICNPIKLKHFTITAVPAYHKDLQEDANCVGLIIETSNGQKLVGFTGDTVWTGKLSSHYKECPVVCVNMGALIDIRKGENFETIFKNKEHEKRIKQLIYKENHLYLPGTVTLIEELRKSKITKLAIIGELGEELKSGLRKDLFYKFNEFVDHQNRKQLFKSPLKVVVEDIGLTITWNGQIPFIRCSRCKRTISTEKVKLFVTEDSLQSEQLDYYCENCLYTLESLQTGVEKHWQKRYLPPQKP